MARPAFLAAVRAQPLRPALRRPLLRVPLRRLALGGAGAIAVLALAYVVARETPLFAIGDFEVVGAPAEGRREVRGTLENLAGTSLVEMDVSELERRLRELPSVLDASVDRSFPHTVRVRVQPERPLAVVTDRTVGWVVSRRGRVIRPVEPGASAVLPRVESASAAELAPGQMVTEPHALLFLRSLAGVPSDFPVSIRSARGSEGGLTFVLTGGRELRLGTNDDLGAKLSAARAVLDALPRDERRNLAYLDVSLPQRPVALDKSQVVSES